MRSALKTSIIILLSFQAFSAVAQYKVGLKAGGGLATFSSPSAASLIDIKPGAGYHAGLFAQITRYQSRFFVRPELLYSLRNCRIESGPAAASLQCQYLSLPILFGYMPSSKLNVLAGIEPAFLVNSGTSALTLTNPNSMDVLLDLGLAYNITYNLGIELRAGHGVMNLLDLEWSDSSGNITKEKASFARLLQLSVSYNFAKEGKSNITPVFR